MKKLGILTLSAVLGLALAPVAAHADPIVGSIGFAGQINPDPGPGLDSGGLHFVGAYVAGGTGDYAAVPILTPATFTDFTFDPFSGSVSPLWTVTSGGLSYSFDLESIAIEDSNATHVLLSGTGTLHITGKDDTYGTWAFSAENASGGSLFTFNSNTGVPTEGGSEGEGAVPEPASLLLLGLGMTGVASRIARRRK